MQGLTVCLVLILLFGGITGETAGPVRKVYVTGTTVNIRSGPSLNFDVIQVVKADTALEVVGEETDWYQVKLDTGQIGWIAKSTVTLDPPESAKIRRLEETVQQQQQKIEALTRDLTLASEQKQDFQQKMNEMQTTITELQLRREEIRQQERRLWILISIGILLLGWGLGFLAGYFVKRKEDRRFQEMKAAAAYKATSAYNKGVSKV